MATLKTAHTPDGFVVRRILPNGEDAYRWRPDGEFDRCLGGKGPWFRTYKALIPAAVLAEFAKAKAEQDAA